MSTASNTCLECRSKLVGRSDKKFCDNACRNEYHNRVNSEVNNYMRNVNNALKRNRKILNQLLSNGIENLNSTILNASGFDFNYYTHSNKMSDGTFGFFCYEVGYAFENETSVKIITIEPFSAGSGEFGESVNL